MKNVWIYLFLMLGFLLFSSCQEVDYSSLKPSETPLAVYLNEIQEEDQKYRQRLDEIREKYGQQSNPVIHLWSVIFMKDSINRLKVQWILDEYGWISWRKIGGPASSTLFLVIQHSPLPVQQKYLPIMRDAVRKGNAAGSSLAMLEDRVALAIGDRQIYGSQINQDRETGEYIVSPMIDPENVNSRRAEVGLGTIEEYVSIWDIIWDAEQFENKQLGISVNPYDDVTITLSEHVLFKWSNLESGIVENNQWDSTKNYIESHQLETIKLIMDETVTRAFECAEDTSMTRGQLAFAAFDLVINVPYNEVFPIQLDAVEEGCRYPVGLFQFIRENHKKTSGLLRQHYK
ncbi:hypothetical protein JYT72_00445 [Crocinitomix catalasitica]|nr:hypothetical protein [Crocinitomix catalasitica]